MCRYWVGSESLRGLRSGRLDADTGRSLSEQLHALDLLVRDGSGRYFQLLVRDEPPAPVAEALLRLVGPAR